MSYTRFIAVLFSLMVAFSACIGRTPALLKAAREGRVDDVKILLKDGVSVDTSNEDGITPLMEAAQNGHLDIVQAFIDAGVDVNAQDNGNETAVTKAKKNGHNDIVELLKLVGGTSVPYNWRDLYNMDH